MGVAQKEGEEEMGGYHGNGHLCIGHLQLKAGPVVTEWLAP